MLTIKDISHPVSFIASVEIITDFLHSLGEIVIDRTMYNIRYGSGKFLQNLGDNLIHDDFVLQFKLIGQDHKDKLFTAEAKYTTLTKVFTGRLSRGIRNRLTEELKTHENLFAPYPLQSKFIGLLKAYPATANSNPDFKSYWARQSASLLRHRDAKILIETLINDTKK